MSTRNVIGLTLGVAGTLISVIHLALAFFSRVAERDHNHGAIVATGLILAIVGILMMDKSKK